ncbi:glycoside hydrolase family 2 [Streptomyces sp. SID13666]|uniref:AbfB domain-containing protein n=1 Tax=unclassified Streptomyces TaxID=2593676 RepID=UPI0013C0BE00|nr:MULTISPECIES: AbfB domain-containing protein [unclassified Streptomyces]NEA53990.1 glycoside hydrolase family 2 [Streptomyces sp. SID13666]NEA70868.1 glycoside hydrolase family 2 [Streptomyces sp. SID13588]
MKRPPGTGNAPWRRRLVSAFAVLALAAGALAALGPAPASAATWSPKPSPMTTPWTNQVSVDNPLPEYPRPQLTRPDWANLNGIWDFAVTGRDAGQPAVFGEQIRVPFVAESALSGIQRKITQNDKLWYKRTFTVPSTWNGRRVQLNFGASDWQTTVWVNGRQAGAVHKGGYDAFSYDITSLLTGGSNTVVVSVYDPTQTGGQAVGKQRINDVAPHPGGGIFYTAASGIWQTVWLEPVAAAHITRVDMTPNLANNTLRVTVRGDGISGQSARVTVSAAGGTVGTATGPVGTEFSVAVPNAHRWSPDDPFLYDVRADLTSGGATVDSVGSYTGMRSIALAKVDNIMRPVLNGKFVFQSGTLDQGFWPDGIYTAPTDAALRSDLQAHKDLGFNMVRKHIKVEPQRWFYWADRLGLLVWQDMPAMDTGKSPDSAARAQWETEFHAVIDQHRSSPALIQWVDQNEGWGQYDQARIANDVKAYDPSRLVDNMSGVNCCGSVDGGNGDVVDNHNYVGPGNTAPSPTRAAVLGEYGGLGFKVAGHEWYPGGGFSYEDQPTLTALNDRFTGLLDAIRLNQLPAGLSASVYTEITDVENEVNGLLTYDRQVMKVDAARVKAANQALINASLNPPPPVVLPVGQYKSLRVTTPGFTNRYLRHTNALAYTEVVDGNSSAVLKSDATWKIVTGLANSACYSFESRNFPGEFLRHQNFRVRRDPDDGSALFKADATFCAVQGNGGVRLSAANYPGSYIRHINAEVWLATPGGGHTWDNPATFTEDTTWAVDPPWAP